MKEQDLEIKQNGQYNNINIVTRYQWDKKTKQFVFDANGDKIVKEQGIKPDHYVIVKKKYADAKEIKSQFPKANGEESYNYSCAVTYKDTECSFFLKDFLYNQYKDVGGADDLVKISCVIENKLNKKLGIKVPVEVLKFEKVE